MFKLNKTFTPKNDLDYKFFPGNTEMQNQADFTKANLNSEINLKNLSFPLIVHFLLQITIRNRILNHQIVNLPMVQSVRRIPAFSYAKPRYAVHQQQCK